MTHHRTSRERRRPGRQEGTGRPRTPGTTPTRRRGGGRRRERVLRRGEGGRRGGGDSSGATTHRPRAPSPRPGTRRRNEEDLRRTPTPTTVTGGDPSCLSTLSTGSTSTHTSVRYISSRVVPSPGVPSGNPRGRGRVRGPGLTPDPEPGPG